MRGKKNKREFLSFFYLQRGIFLLYLDFIFLILLISAFMLEKALFVQFQLKLIIFRFIWRRYLIFIRWEIWKLIDLNTGNWNEHHQDSRNGNWKKERVYNVFTSHLLFYFVWIKDKNWKIITLKISIGKWKKKCWSFHADVEISLEHKRKNEDDGGSSGGKNVKSMKSNKKRTFMCCWRNILFNNSNIMRFFCSIKQQRYFSLFHLHNRPTSFDSLTFIYYKYFLVWLNHRTCTQISQLNTLHLTILCHK